MEAIMFRAIIDYIKSFSFKKLNVGQFVIKGRIRRPLPKPSDNKPMSVIKEISYVMNDLSTPHLIKTVRVPDLLPSPAFYVNGYNGGGYNLGTPEQTAANVYITINNVINMVNHHSDIKMNGWARTKRLNVYPFAGNQFNAFYNGAALKFFTGVDPSNGKNVNTADSSEVVAHETGHAVLDYFKPDLWNKASLEFFAFHEGFADLIAMLTILQNDEIIHDIIVTTNGNLRISNVASKIAEHLGSAIYHSSPSSLRLSDCLREAINNFQYQAPETLPSNVNSYNELCAEPHNFGRIMLGVFYDILEMIYNFQLSRGLSKEDALKLARNILTAYALKTIQHTPTTPKFFEAFCKTMLWVDSISDKNYTEKLREIFQARKILPAITMLDVRSLKDVRVPETIICDMVNKNDEVILIQGREKTVKLASVATTLSSDHTLSDYLYDVEIDLAIQSLFVTNKDGFVIESLECSESDAMKAAFDALIFLDKNQLISDDPFTPFEIKNGKLIRTHFSSCIKKTENDPEWGKL
jgi:hypothetical protein